MVLKDTDGAFSSAHCWVPVLLWMVFAYLASLMGERASRRRREGDAMRTEKISTIVRPAVSVISAYAVAIAAALG
jgi:hypothetical protein